ncbi:MAG: hypothetical protein LBG68_00515 [Coriobacteriales bacterium]|jgi:hypothetical protein|nr:hypothetical protein [Coriobacteriales bacterium]
MDSNTQSRVSSLSSQIAQKEGRISYLWESISTLKRCLDDTLEARRLHSQAAYQFITDRSSGIKSTQVLASIKNAKISGQIAERITSQLSGWRFADYNESVDKNGQILDNEITKLEDEIKVKQKEIASLTYEITIAQAQTRALIAGVS